MSGPVRVNELESHGDKFVPIVIVGATKNLVAKLCSCTRYNERTVVNFTEPLKGEAKPT